MVNERGLELPRSWKYSNYPRPSATNINFAWGRVQTALDMLPTAMIRQSSGLMSPSAYSEILQECRAREKEAMDLTREWWRGVPNRYRRHLPIGLREDFS